MLQAVRTQKDGGLQLALSGVIDETTDLQAVFKDLPRSISIDLRGIERINSVGCRFWVEMMAKLGAYDLTIEAVSYPLVLQAICLRSFFGRARVASCMAPFFCPSCSRPEEVLVRREEVIAGRIDRQCPGCHQPMYFDELDQYFHVLYEG